MLTESNSSVNMTYGCCQKAHEEYKTQSQTYTK